MTVVVYVSLCIKVTFFICTNPHSVIMKTLLVVLVLVVAALASFEGN